MNSIESFVEEFTSRLAALVESQTLERAREAVESALGGTRGGRAPKVSAIALSRNPRKKLPKQFCPVPGCKNLAAPVFGMVCSEHKGVAKAKIKKYREARRAAKLGANASKTRAVKSKKKKRSKIVRKPKKMLNRATKTAARKMPVARPKAPKRTPQKASSKVAQAPAASPPITAAAA